MNRLLYCSAQVVQLKQSQQKVHRMPSSSTTNLFYQTTLIFSIKWKLTVMKRKTRFLGENIRFDFSALSLDFTSL